MCCAVVFFSLLCCIDVGVVDGHVALRQDAVRPRGVNQVSIERLMSKVVGHNGGRDIIGIDNESADKFNNLNPCHFHRRLFRRILSFV
jgi:hypothetical protein